MCGIWGTVNIGDRAIAEAAAEAMSHRGPDDHGEYVANEPMPVALVNTRLAIIDLSPGGHQPMSTPDGRYWIVYNGEVYNYQPLRQILLDAGHTFHGNSDTEVILHAYAEWGERCLEHLRGMFAIAIWDTVEAKLFLARDRLGIKPIYYTQAGTPGNENARFAFASELKALMISGLVTRQLNYAALHHYLSFYAVPTPYSMLEGVESLPPGHFLIYQDHQIRIKKYWSLPSAEPVDLSREELVVQLRHLLEESIRLRMIADVPVGAFLSGGIDSSAVVALMTRISGERLRTFSIGFGEEGHAIDERSAARMVADQYGTDHTEVVVTGRDVRNQIDAIIKAMDQPTGDGLNTYLVSQATGQHVKVALSGLGGDELFAGYPQFKLFQQADQARNLWNKLPNVAQEMTRGTATVVDPLRRAITWLDGDLLERYERVRILYTEEEKLNLYASGTLDHLAAPEPSLQYLGRHVHPVEADSMVQLTRLELENYMAHTLLRDTDAMSMAHSLEVRVPLIDHKLVEFAANIPGHYKLHNGQGKWIFIKALEDVLPKDILERPKQGFEMPIAAWMRGALRDVVEDVFSADSIKRRGLFRVEPMQNAYREFLEGQSIYMRVWSLVTLELWMRRFLDRAQ